jgi:hypothetical protein
MHGLLAFLVLPSGGRVKTKNPPPYGDGFDKFRENSKPVRRAGQKRVRKQQVQVVLHGATIAHLLCLVIGKIVEWFNDIRDPRRPAAARRPP